MSKRFWTCILTTVALLSAGAASADHHGQHGYMHDTTHKLSRGLVNVIASPIEIPVNIYKENAQAADRRVNYGERGAAWLAGFFNGVGYMLTRIAVGTLDTVSFPLPTDALMYPAAPRGIADTIGPLGPTGAFAVAGRINQRPRKSLNEWVRDGASAEDFYEDRFRCASSALRTGLFNECMRERGWMDVPDLGY